MNAVATPPSRRRLPAWLDALLTAVEPWRALLVPLFALAPGALGVWMRGSGPPSTAPIAETMVAFAVAMLWGGWLVRTVLLARQAKQACLPGVGGAVARGLAFAGGFGLLLPALLLARQGVAPATAASIAVAGAAGGSLFVLLSWQQLGGLYLAGLAAVGLLRLAGATPPWAEPGREGAWAACAVLLSLGALWRWHRVLRVASLQGVSRHARPMVFAQSDPVDRDADGAGNDWSFGTLGRARLATLAPGSERALRGALGQPFAPLSRAGALGNALVVLAGLPLLAWAITRDRDLAAFAVGALIGIVATHMVLALMAVERLDALRRARSGELAELALLPGVGGTAGANALMARAVLGWILRGSGVVLALMLASAAAAGLAGTALALLLLCWSSTTLAVVLAAARQLAGESVRRAGALIPLAAGLLLALACAIATMVPQLSSTAYAVLLAAWIALCGFSWRRLRTLRAAAAKRPHPFLLP